MSKTLLVLLLLSACASAPPEPPPPDPALATAKPAPKPRPARAFDARALASQARTASECASFARDLHGSDAQKGWDLLSACVERERYEGGLFTNWQLVLNNEFHDELRKRPAAPRLLAHIIAMRGGDVDGDISALQQQQLPVLGLREALDDPKANKGRLVIVRGLLRTARIEEMPKARRFIEVTLHSDLQKTNQWDRSGTLATHAVATDLTGFAVLDKDALSVPDEVEYVFLARFDGAGAAGQRLEALLTILASYIPSKLLVD